MLSLAFSWERVRRGEGSPAVICSKNKCNNHPSHPFSHTHPFSSPELIPFLNLIPFLKLIPFLVLILVLFVLMFIVLRLLVLISAFQQKQLF